MSLPQTDATSDPQSIIEALQQRLHAALSEKAALAEALALRNSEFGERIEHQAATLDVLKAMSASPGDPQPVFDLIVRHAQELCNSKAAGIFEYDGELVHLRSHYGDRDIAGAATYRAAFPMKPIRGSFACRAILDQEIVHVRDVGAEQDRAPVVQGVGIGSALAIPLLRDGAAIGAFVINSIETGGFSDSQVALSKAFAEQAVIAITSAETYRALQTRTSDLQESLEYQTATSDVLKVISQSTFDLQPVLDTVVETAARLCEADQAVIARREGEALWLEANYGFPPEYEAAAKALGVFPLDRNSPMVAHRVLIEGHTVHIHDVATVPGYPDTPIHLGKQRTSLAVPLLRESVPVGVILLARQRVEPFTDRQIELVSTFADQAVIAIENTRLLTEQREALEQQTATAEVLRVINNSPGNLTPVFDAILEKAHRICNFDMGSLATYDGTFFCAVATRGYGNQAEVMARTPYRPLTAQRALLRGDRLIHIPDMQVYPVDPDDAAIPAFVTASGFRACLMVPLRKDGTLLGFLTGYRKVAGPLSEMQIVLLENFAAQAVIAMENARLINEQREALEQQIATAEALQVINASPGNLAPVFDAMLEKAMRLCEAAFAYLLSYDGDEFQAVAHQGLPPRFAEYLPRMDQPGPTGSYARILGGAPLVHVTDLMEGDVYQTSPLRRALVDLGGARTSLIVAIRKEDRLLGIFTIYRREVRQFSDKQVALVESFAAQAAIAIENARLLTEQQEALEQQTATAEVLQVINASPGDLTPVFEAMLEKAMRLCEAAHGALQMYDGERFWPSRAWGILGLALRPSDATPHESGSALRRIVDGDEVVHIPDVRDTDAYRRGLPLRVRFVDSIGARTALWVALRKSKALLGVFVMYRQEVQPFTDKQIALLQNFAAQAVIAMESARLLHELRARTDELAQRQVELRVTFENMGDGVAMFDETPRLVAWNRKFQDIFDLPDGVLAERLTFAEYIRYLTARGEFGLDADPDEQIRRLTENADKYRAFERVRPDGRVIEIRHNPVAGGGFVLIYADITERKRSEAEIRAARDAAEEASRTIEAAYRDLKTAQANLIQAEKMASLGQLTAGIAHEIKNPLNFVNNFAELSVELLKELKDAIAPAEAALRPEQRDEVDDVVTTLTSNLEKITEHGKRADGIVRAMLEHSRGSSGERRIVDLNALIDEALNLAYHGARAQDQSFNITLERDFGEGIAPFELVPQDITRVLLNLFANGLYATTRRARDGADGFEPTLRVGTRAVGEMVEIRVWDNGIGIPADIRDKLFQPFFTTKPTGEGTGLGLSISYDIITQQHGGSIAVDSKVGEYSEFTIRLPRNF